MSVLPNLTYRFNVIPIKISASYFLYMDKLILKFFHNFEDVHFISFCLLLAVEKAKDSFNVLWTLFSLSAFNIFYLFWCLQVVFTYVWYRFLYLFWSYDFIFLKIFKLSIQILLLSNSPSSFLFGFTVYVCQKLSLYLTYILHSTSTCHSSLSVVVGIFFCSIF